MSTKYVITITQDEENDLYTVEINGERLECLSEKEVRQLTLEEIAKIANGLYK